MIQSFEKEKEKDAETADMIEKMIGLGIQYQYNPENASNAIKQIINRLSTGPNVDNVKELIEVIRGAAMNRAFFWGFDFKK